MSRQVNHLTEEQQVDAYYGETTPEIDAHLHECSECRASTGHLKELLDNVREYASPERDAGYGGEVWRRLLPRLQPDKPSRPKPWGLGKWALIPALAASIFVAFYGGMVAQHQRESGSTAKMRERVLLIAMSEYLERSQIVLAELVNARAGEADLSGERERARALIADSRLLRQTALHEGDRAHAALLDDLERVLLDVANGPAQMAPEELATLQRRIEEQELLFKVRVTSTDAREKGQKL